MIYCAGSVYSQPLLHEHNGGHAVHVYLTKTVHHEDCAARWAHW